MKLKTIPCFEVTFLLHRLKGLRVSSTYGFIIFKESLNNKIKIKTLFRACTCINTIIQIVSLKQSNYQQYINLIRS